MKKYFFYLTILMALPGAFSVLAQSSDESPHMARETLEALFIVALKRDLSLDSVSAVELAEKLSPILDSRREFIRRQRRLEKALQAELETGVENDESLQQSVLEILNLRQEFVQSERELFLEATEQLKPAQQARALLLIERFEKKVRRQLREHQKLRKSENH